MGVCLDAVTALALVNPAVLWRQGEAPGRRPVEAVSEVRQHLIAMHSTPYQHSVLSTPALRRSFVAFSGHTSGRQLAKYG